MRIIFVLTLFFMIFLAFENKGPQKTKFVENKIFEEVDILFDKIKKIKNKEDVLDKIKLKIKELD